MEVLDRATEEVLDVGLLSALSEEISKTGKEKFCKEVPRYNRLISSSRVKFVSIFELSGILESLSESSKLLSFTK